MSMIVIGADTHRASHTCAAVTDRTGELLEDRTIPARRAGFEALLEWGSSLGEERAWAIEDCRHVSGGLERFLIERGPRWEGAQVSSSPLAEYFGRRLRHRRSLACLSQAELARLLDLHRTEIGALERGLRVPRLDTILKLAAGVEAEPCELIAGLRWRPRVEILSGGTYAGRGEKPEGVSR